jgi:hypothetical protein
VESGPIASGKTKEQDLPINPKSVGLIRESTLHLNPVSVGLIRESTLHLDWTLKSGVSFKEIWGTAPCPGVTDKGGLEILSAPSTSAKIG